MRRVLSSLLFGWFAAATGVAAPAVAADRPVTMAVAVFRSYYPRVKRELADRVVANLSKDPRLVLLDRAELDRVLTEQALDLSRDIDPGTAALVGRLTGAGIIITGILSQVQPDESYTLRVRITGTATGRAFIEEAVGHTFGTAANDRPAVAAEAARKIVSTIFARATELLGPPLETREARIAAIATAAPAGKRSTVSLRFTAAGSASALSPQSTVETELGLILQRAGFAVLAENATPPAKIEIVGDVVADSGTKLGSLFPCRAVINAKVRECETGRIILLERQAADVMDIGEQTALSAALEKAADALAARIVPVLSQPARADSQRPH